jgi:HEAT repeat protein
MTASFDDGTVAQLLATALALDGHASERLATILNTIVPDDERKQRVVTMTRTLLSETDFGRSNQFQALWASMEELLISYNDRAFVSDTYRAALDEIGGRAERLAAADLPPELDAWMETLGQANVRSLSVALLIDLLRLEEAEARACDIAQDMAALAEDLMMAGAYDDALAVTSTVAERAARAGAVGRDGCRRALDRLGASSAARETASMVGDLDDAMWTTVRALFERIGPGSIDALRMAVGVEVPTVGSERAGDLIVTFGAHAVSRLATLVADPSWAAQCAAAQLLGRIAAPSAVPLLQPLLRAKDPRVASAAVAALGNIDDPAAARALQIVLRGTTGDRRHAMVDALVRERDPRVVPMLVRILGESQVLGADHEVALQTLDALRIVANEQAVPAIVKTVSCRGFFRKKRQRAVKEHGVDALAAIGGAKAAAALRELSKSGDRLLKQIIANTPTAERESLRSSARGKS